MLYFSLLQTQLFQIFMADFITKLLENVMQVEIAFYFQVSFSHHEVLKSQMFSEP